MKSPKELNFANSIMKVLQDAQSSGVDVKNVLDSISSKWQGDDNSAGTTPINLRDHVGKRILYTTSFDYFTKMGRVKEVSPKGFIEIEVYTGMNDNTHLQWYDPSTLYIQEIFEGSSI